MHAPLTPIERRVDHFLLDYLSEHTYQPSIREIGKRFRIRSTKTVADVLRGLAEKGYIERDASRSRGVRLVGHSTMARTRPVPCYGRLNAGEPMLLPEHRERWITMDRAFLPGDDAYFLRVQGDSMVGRGIHDRDYVLVDPTARARDGDIIAARLGADATVKTLLHRGASIVLEPASADHREIVVGPADDFAVLGVVAAVFRPFHERTDAMVAGDDQGAGA